MEHDGDYDAAYYARREKMQRELAEEATDPAVKRIHAELADRYAAKAGKKPPD